MQTTQRIESPAERRMRLLAEQRKKPFLPGMVDDPFADPFGAEPPAPTTPSEQVPIPLIQRQRPADRPVNFQSILRRAQLGLQDVPQEELGAVREAFYEGKDPLTFEETQILTAGMFVIGAQALLEGLAGSGLAEFKKARSEGTNFDRAILRGYRAQDLPTGVKGTLELLGPEDILPGGLLLGASLGVGKLGIKGVRRLAKLRTVDEIAEAVGVDKPTFVEMLKSGKGVAGGADELAGDELDKYTDLLNETLAGLAKTPEAGDIAKRTEDAISKNSGKAGTSDAVYYRVEDTQENWGPVTLAEADTAARELAGEGYKVTIYPSKAPRSRYSSPEIDMDGAPLKTILPTVGPPKKKVAKPKRPRKTGADIYGEHQELMVSFIRKEIDEQEYAKRYKKIVAAFKNAGGEEISLESLADRIKRGGVLKQPEKAVEKKPRKTTKAEVDKVLEEVDKLLGQGYVISEIDRVLNMVTLTKGRAKDKVIKVVGEALELLEAKKQMLDKVTAKPGAAVADDPFVATAQFMITTPMKVQLRALGFTDADIGKMTPLDATKRIDEGVGPTTAPAPEPPAPAPGAPAAAPTADSLAAAKAAGAADAAREAAAAAPTTAKRGARAAPTPEPEVVPAGAAPTGKPGKTLPPPDEATRKAAKTEADAALAEKKAKAQKRVDAAKKKDVANRIDLNKFTPDVKEFLREALENPQAVLRIDRARRGKLSEEQILEEAKRIARRHGYKVSDTWKPGTAFNAAELVAIEIVTENAARKARNAAKKVAKKDKGTVTNNDRAQYLARQVELIETLNVFTGTRSEAGRALRALQIDIKDIGKEMTDAELEKLAIRFGIKKKRSLEEIADVLANHFDPKDPSAIYRTMRELDKPGMFDYITELWLNGILSSPKTQIINMLGNFSAFAASIPEQIVAIGIEKIVAKITRREAMRFWQELPAGQAGTLYGLAQGIPAAFKAMQYGSPLVYASKIDMRKHAFDVYADNPTTRFIARVINSPTQALEVADTLGYSVNFHKELYILVKQEGMKKGLKGKKLQDFEAALLEHPSQDLLKEAKEQANYRLFRGDDAFSNEVIKARESFKPFRFIIPFVRTPTNLLKFGLERSPIGMLRFLNPSTKGRNKWRQLMAGDPHIADELSRAVLGSLGALGIYFAFADGRITSAAPSSPGERDRFYREGKLPYAIKMGDTWVQYQRLEPFNQVLGEVGIVADFLERGDDEGAAEAAGAAIAHLMENLTSQTFMSGLSDFLEVLNAGDETYKYQRFGRRMLGSMVPFSSLLRTAAQANDPTFRTIDHTFWQAWQFGLPGMTDELEPQMNAFGEAAVRPGAWWLPIQYSPDAISTIDVELENTGLEIGKASRRLGDLELTPAWYTAYQNMSGTAITETLGATIAHPLYQALDTADREIVLEGVIRRARDWARTMLKIRMAQEGDIAPASIDPPGEVAGKTTGEVTEEVAEPPLSAALTPR